MPILGCWRENLKFITGLAYENSSCVFFPNAYFYTCELTQFFTQSVQRFIEYFNVIVRVDTSSFSRRGGGGGRRWWCGKSSIYGSTGWPMEIHKRFEHFPYCALLGTTRLLCCFIECVSLCFAVNYFYLVDARIYLMMRPLVFLLSLELFVHRCFAFCVLHVHDVRSDNVWLFRVQSRLGNQSALELQN